MINFKKLKNIAIVGLSPNPDKPSYQVGLYLQNQGYNIFPIYPKTQKILGIQALQTIQDLKHLPIEWVVIFRKSEVCEMLVQEIIDLHSPSIQGVWLQLGIQNTKAKDLALKNGLEFVQNRCIKIERENYAN
ncbi:CoA-binding protein [Helicobacter kayseriensis]|uniref:CoA-binding protein n=1 Tax=Helicobacter kayseriensis TaxID=2905877 RepID=UPI001E5D5B10|nr:CoA-binding protein [Helicobacter kayseriensis]MCE3047179.1 CoA-binding protein [Helicobacter kayseriensis]MCE3048550.1 CoA-binding protein [Helicobacter kayseriensis]